jgi:protein SCO1/2
MRASIPVLALSILCCLTPAGARAHHPGEELDAVIAAQEPFFRAVDQPAPDGFLGLQRLEDRIVVLTVLPSPCDAACVADLDRLAEVQGMVNASAMRDMVRFLTVTPDPAGTPEAIGAPPALDPVNWTLLAAPSAEAARALSGDYARLLIASDGTAPVDSPAFHVIDRGGRFAGSFQGLGFEPLNMVLYINGLTNAPR